MTPRTLIMMKPTNRLAWLLAAVLLLSTGCGSCDSDDNNGGTDAGDDAFTDVVDDTDMDVDPDAEDTGDTGDTTDAADTDTDGGGGEDRTVCEDTLPQPSGGAACSITSGTGDLLFLQGVVLADDGVYENGGVLIDRSTGENATMSCVGCGCGESADLSDATVVSCPDSVISPGIINAHEHLGWATNSPVPHGDERYDHRHDWRTGARGSTEINSGGSDFSGDAILYGEMRHMLSGATAIAGSTRGDGPVGFLRNMSNADATGGLSVSADYDTFPLDDTSGTLAADGCSTYDLPNTSVLSEDIYLPHIAEGIDPEAQNEYHCLAGINPDSVDVVESNTSVIHGVGVQASDIADFAASGASLVWSPRTNIDLYGNTADVVTYSNYGVNIALGTDWIVSGSMNMTREMACIDYLNQNHYSNHFTDRQLWEMATKNGAKALGVGDQLGQITEGYIADIAIFAADTGEDYRAVLDAGVSDVRLVMRGGTPLVGDRDLVEGIRSDASNCESIDVCSNDRLICATPDTGSSLSDILGTQQSYEPFYCDDPPDEPTCVPFRNNEYDGMSTADDQDGDGVIDSNDTCPTIFNPARPVDNGTQTDFDQDGIGDPCDTCPLDAGEDCQPFDPNDRDSDGTPNDTDNCPATPNADQADADNDGNGDVCDACPNEPNPDGQGCPGTIYEIRDGTVGVGEAVFLEDVIVTAVNGSSSVFVQVPTDRGDYTGAANSGLNIFVGDVSTMPQRGDRIDVSGTVADFFGLAQLDSLTSITVNSSQNALPTPVVVTPAEIGTGGSRGEELESVLVRVENVEVTDENPDSQDFGEFVVDGELRVDDLMFEILPDPQVGDQFDALVGPLYYSFSNRKLLPRDENDVITGPPRLSDLQPDAVYLENNTTGVTTTPNLQVVLNRAPSTDMTVDLSYSDTSIVDGPATVDVPSGQQSVALQLDGGNVGSATVTASMSGDSFTSTVNVYDPAGPRTLVDLTPASQSIQVSQTGTVTVALDAPAGSGGVDVTLSATGDLSVPATVTVPAGAATADATVTAGSSPGATQVTATLGTDSFTVDVDVLAAPTTPCLIISEYIEGSGSDNKAVELYNCGASDFDLTNFGICLVSNANTTCNATATFSATNLPSDDVYTVCKSTSGDAVDAIKNDCDEELSNVMNFNGNDRLLVFRDEDGDDSYDDSIDVLTDAFGQPSVEPSGDPWANSLYRRCDTTPYDATSTFDVSTYYNAYSPTETSDWGLKPTEACN
jgi:cytosine/adenosine deaminase-related metal-dependent hydrolase